MTLVNQDVIKFLGSCEADSIKLEKFSRLYSGVD